MRLAANAFVLATLLSTGASGYYHFVHFASRVAPFRPVPEKFDLNVLPNKTLTYFIDDPSSLQLASGDSYTSLISQIRLAAGVWNDVESSDLRIAFGGLTSTGSSQSLPAVEMLFQEVPPGLVAMGGPTIRAASNSNFVPILKSVVIIQQDLRTRASYTESIFSTLVHEFGHALGLQHTLTSSVMSTSVTRATSKARPLSADDVAAISILYPKPGYGQATGTISGRVTMNGQGVNLASVVAITPNGMAISTLTNPDGTYQIQGLTPGGCYVYVHPLPPPREGQATPADIVYPLDADGGNFPVGSPFETVFFNSGAGVKDPAQATIVAVQAGSPTENINFNVRQRTGYGIHSVETYAFPGSTAVKPPYLSPGMVYPFLVATGSGLISASGPVQGLRATVLGGGDLSVRAYPGAPSSYIELDFDPRILAIPSNTPRHIVFSANNDIYVLPSAFFHVDRQPPQIANVTAQTDGGPHTAVISGVNLFPDTRIYFDGAAAPVRNFEDLGFGAARLTVGTPAAGMGQHAAVVALNGDGQSSLFVQSAPPDYAYPADAFTALQASASVTPNALAPGTEALLQIDAAASSFADGQVTVGFGSSDIVVRRAWVVSPTRIMLNVAAAPGAQPAALNVTIASGLQLITQPFAFFVQQPQARSFWLVSGVTNTANGQPSVSPGSVASMQAGASPVPLSTSNVTVVLNDVRLPALSVAGNQITFQIPQNMQPGYASVRLEIGTDRSLPIGINIDPAPPRILAAAIASKENRSARAGDLLVLSVLNLKSSASDVAVRVGDREASVVQIAQDGDKENVFVQLPPDTPTGDSVQLTVTADERTSEPISITITK